MRTVLTTLLLAFLLISTTAAQPGPPDHARPIEGVILIKFAPEALETPPQQLRPNKLGLQGPQAARLRQLLNTRRGPGQKLFRNFAPADTLGRHRQTGERVRLKDLSRWYRFPVRDTANVDTLAARLQKLPLVLEATPDYEASPAGISSEGRSAPSRNEPNDPNLSFQWGYDDSGDTDVDAPEAWSLQTGRSDVTVAVVDGGVDLDHPDLDLGDGSRVIQGYDFGDDDNDADDDRPSGFWSDHGTPVAGTIGARTDNGEGVAGLMWDLQIMPLKIIESDETGNPSSSRVAEAFDYARSNGADIINFSGGSPSPNGPSSEAAYNAYASGMIVVSSSGNDSTDSVVYPAALHTSVGVGATNRDDERYEYSNYGFRLDVVAPSDFLTTSRSNNDDLYVDFGGTSQAAPMVSGIAGLILSESRDEGHNLSNNDVVNLLERTADNVQEMSGDFDTEYGHGRVNAYEALRRLNDPYEVTHGTASFTKIDNDRKVDFLDGFITENGKFYGAGTYVCDVYELSASASSPDFQYQEKPWFWLPVTEKGWSAANPNDGIQFLSKSVSTTSAEATTYFYYVETNIAGQDIGWVPFDPTVHKRNGDYEYTVIGKPGTPPPEASISGPSSLDNGSTGTWTASVDGGSGSVSYSWEYKGAQSSSYSPAGCSGSSCTRTFYNSSDRIQTGGMQVTVTKGGESDTAAMLVTVSPSCGDDVLLCPETLARSGRQGVRALRAVVKNGTVHLSWETAAAGSSSVFTVQARADTTAAWSRIGEVPAADSVRSDTTRGTAYRYPVSDLDVGNHQFRVGIQSTSKRTLYSSAVSAQVTIDDAYRLSAYPNPIRDNATIKLAVKERQNVSIAVYDVLGRRVTTLHDGPLPGQQARQFSLDADRSDLASGTYFLRVEGESFVEDRQLTVIQ